MLLLLDRGRWAVDALLISRLAALLAVLSRMSVADLTDASAINRYILLQFISNWSSVNRPVLAHAPRNNYQRIFSVPIITLL